MTDMVRSSNGFAVPSSTCRTAATKYSLDVMYLRTVVDECACCSQSKVNIQVQLFLLRRILAILDLKTL